MLPRNPYFLQDGDMKHLNYYSPLIFIELIMHRVGGYFFSGNLKNSFCSADVRDDACGGVVNFFNSLTQTIKC